MRKEKIKRLLKKNSFFIFLFISFLILVYLKSKQGVILFGDNDVSLWRENELLLNRFIWIGEDNGYYSPLFYTSFPFQTVFKLLTMFFSMNVVGAVYFFGAFFFFVFSAFVFVGKAAKKKSLKKIDYLILLLFAISVPLIATQIFGQINLVYSLSFAMLFWSHLLVCKRNGQVSIRDIVILSVYVLFMNTYLFITMLVLGSTLVYFLVFHLNHFAKNWAKVFFATLLLLFLNLFWLIHPLQTALFGDETVSESINYSQDEALSVLNISSAAMKPYLPFIFSSGLTDEEENISHFFSNGFVLLCLFTVIVIVFHKMFSEKEEEKKSFFMFLTSVFLASFILSLGSSVYFGDLFLFLWDNLPGLSYFRSIFKFQFLMFFPFLILFAMTIIEMKKSTKIVLLCCVIVLSSFYFLSPVYRKLVIPNKVPDYYFELENYLERKKLISNYKIFPDVYYGSRWLYTSFDWTPNVYDSTNIITFFSGDQGMIFTPAFSEIGLKDEIIREQLCHEESGSERDLILAGKVLSLSNSKSVIMQNDIRYKDSSCFDPIESSPRDVIGKLHIYEIGRKSFLPRFYVSDNTVVSKRDLDEFQRIISSDGWENQSAVFFKKQNIDKMDELDNLLNRKVEGEKEMPTLEFKKINPTKYRIRAYGARGEFPLVFSESFHDAWRVYARQVESNKVHKVESGKILKQAQNDKLKDYKILDGNEGDQATKEEVEDFIEKGYITDLGDGKEKEIKHQKWNEEKQREELDYVEKHKIDFISKNFHGTIQNDNLPEGNFWETWLPVSYKVHKVESDKVKSGKLASIFRNEKVVELPEEKHLMVNGYANAWMVDVNEVCKVRKVKSDKVENTFCVKNDDGSYDMELVVEFWPQRLFYVGIAVSGITLLVCLGYLGYDFYKKKKHEK